MEPITHDNLNQEDFELHLPPELKQAIEIAKAQLDNGEGNPHDVFMEEVKKRFLRKRNF